MKELNKILSNLNTIKKNMECTSFATASASRDLVIEDYSKNISSMFNKILFAYTLLFTVIAVTVFYNVDNMLLRCFTIIAMFLFEVVLVLTKEMLLTKGKIVNAKTTITEVVTTDYTSNRIEKYDNFEKAIVDIYENSPSSLLDCNVFLNILKRNLAITHLQYTVVVLLAQHKENRNVLDGCIAIYISTLYDKLVDEFVSIFRESVHTDDVKSHLRARLSDIPSTITGTAKEKCGDIVQNFDGMQKAKYIQEKIDIIDESIKEQIQSYVSAIENTCINDKMISLFFEKVDNVLFSTDAKWGPSPSYILFFRNIEKVEAEL